MSANNSTPDSPTNEDDPSSSIPQQPINNAPPEFKWLPLQRDYQLEYSNLAAKLILTRSHPFNNKINSNPNSIRKHQQSAAITANNTQTANGTDTANGGDPTQQQQQSTNSNDTEDPLAQMKRINNTIAKPSIDPLSLFSAANITTNTINQNIAASFSLPSSISSSDGLNKKQKTTAIIGEFYEPWKDKRVKILSKYTTSKKISVASSFLEEEKLPINRQVAESKSRLEELEADAASAAAAANAQNSNSNGTNSSLLTQKEYISHIEEQGEKLKQAWEAGERVVSLKIAIQCAKLLGDISVPAFYPSMFVLLTDILDSFGDLVFDRIKKKGIDIINSTTKTKSSSSLPMNFNQTDVSSSAVETCQNWFYKTACIRELLPRLYVEMGLFKCYRFLYDSSVFVSYFQRLSRMIRGIGDPLIAIYARAYLCTKMGDLYMSYHAEYAKSGEARHIPAEYQAILHESYTDFLHIFQYHYTTTKFNGIKYITNQSLTVDDYLLLFCPGIEWLLQNIGYSADRVIFETIFLYWKEHNNTSLFLYYLLSSFDPVLISRFAMNLTALIKNSDDIAIVSKAKCYLVLGKNLVKIPPSDKHKLPLLNEVWKQVTKLTNIHDYMELAEIYIQFLCTHFSDREINIFLKDIIKHIKEHKSDSTPSSSSSSSSSPTSSTTSAVAALSLDPQSSAYKLIQENIVHILTTIMQLSRDLRITLTMDHVLLFLDLLDKKLRIAASKSILEQWSFVPYLTHDPVIVHSLMDVSTTLHDSVDSLTFEDEKKQIAQLIIAFIRKVDYGRDLESQLSFYVDCRAAFGQIDVITIEIIHRILLLASRTHFYTHGNHSKKTSAFVKSCLASVHVTIPSCDDHLSKCRLFLIAAEIALMNQMILQSEGYCKAIINLIAEIPLYVIHEASGMKVNQEDEFLAFLNNFIAFLLLFPGHPEHGPFYLIKALLNAIQNFPPWSDANQTSSNNGKIRVYLNVLSLFFTYYQRSFPYHLVSVISNDSLYANDNVYMNQLSTIIDILMTEIMTNLLKIGEKNDLISKKILGNLALEFTNLLLSSITMNATSASLIVKLIQIVHRAGSSAVDQRYLQQTIQHVGGKKGKWYEEITNKLESEVGTTNTTATSTTAKNAITSKTTASPLTSSSLSALKPSSAAQSPLFSNSNTTAKTSTSTTSTTTPTTTATKPAPAVAASPSSKPAPAAAASSPSSVSSANSSFLGRPLVGAGPGAGPLPLSSNKVKGPL